VAATDPNTAICTWTEGNNQPQRDGTWIAAVDITPDSNLENGPDAQSRLLWKEQIDGDKEIQEGRRTYSVRAMHSRLMEVQPDGSLGKSTTMFFRSGDLRGRNRDNENGGTYRAFQIAVIKATRDGMEYITPKENANDLFLGIDGTHLVMCGGVFGGGTDVMPGFTLMQGSHNGGGVSEPIAKMVGYNPTTKKFEDLGTQRIGGSYDRHLYSNYLGNNPGNQGRNFAGCEFTKNPFVGQNGNTTRFFLAHAMTGKAPELVMNAALKPSSFVSLLPVLSTVGSTRNMLSSEANDEAAGCTTTGGSADGLMLLGLALGLVFIVRKRNS
jgi:hypothetical protein